MLSFVVTIFLLWRMDVEKYSAEDQQKIKENQEKAAAAGKEE